METKMKIQKGLDIIESYSGCFMKCGGFFFFFNLVAFKVFKDSKPKLIDDPCPSPGQISSYYNSIFFFITLVRNIIK